LETVFSIAAISSGLGFAICIYFDLRLITKITNNGFEKKDLNQKNKFNGLVKY